MRGVWSVSLRSCECGDAMHVFEQPPLVFLQIERAVGQDVRLDPLVDANPPREPRVDLVDLLMLLARGLHAHAARDRQAVRVVGDADARPAQRDRPLRQLGDRLAAVAPRGVHLQIAEVGPRARRSTPAAARRARAASRAGSGRRAGTGGASPPRPLLRRRVHRGVDRRRLAGLHQLGDDALARRPDERQCRAACPPRSDRRPSDRCRPPAPSRRACSRNRCARSSAGCARSCSSPAATMFRSSRTTSTKLRCFRFDWVANYPLARKSRVFEAESAGTAIAEHSPGGRNAEERNAAAVVLAGLLCVACGRVRRQAGGAERRRRRHHRPRRSGR